MVGEVDVFLGKKLQGTVRQSWRSLGLPQRSKWRFRSKCDSRQLVTRSSVTYSFKVLTTAMTTSLYGCLVSKLGKNWHRM